MSVRRSEQQQSDDIGKRFWAKVDRRGPDECWSWTGSVSRKNAGGQMRIAGRIEQAARIAYELERGPIEEGLVIDHTCGNSNCLNPAHMQIVCRRAWSDEDDHYLRRMYCFVPASRIAQELGRTEVAVKIRRREIGIVALQKRNDVLSAMDFGRALGVSWPTTRRLIQEHNHFTTTMYHGNRPVTVVLLDSFRRWLRDPVNWQYLDVDKLIRPDFREVVALARRRADDQWLLLKDAASYVGYSETVLKRIVRRGTIPVSRGTVGRRGKPRLLFRKADLDRFIETY